MRELLYVPPGSVRTGAIGLLVPELANPIFPALAQAMETPGDEGRARHDPLQHPRLDGRRGRVRADAARAPRRRDDLHLQRGGRPARATTATTPAWSAKGARIVFVNGAVETLDVPHVGVDERAAGQIATQHLLDLGHQRIGFVAGPDRFRPTREKAHGRVRSPSTRPASRRTGSSRTPSSASRAVGPRCARCSTRTIRPTAVICSSDLMAIGALREATAARPARPRGRLDRRLRRDRGRGLDRSAADHGGAADPGHRPHRGLDAAEPDRRPERRHAGRSVPPAAQGRRLDRRPVGRRLQRRRSGRGSDRSSRARSGPETFSRSRASRTPRARRRS